MKKIRIYVATHKKYEVITGSEYCPIQVGAFGSNDELGYLKDNIGENISEQNSQYCELTAQYWAWKNDHESEISGLCHYRRYFVRDYCSENSFVEDILKRDDIEKILREFEIILPRMEYKVKENAILYKGKKEKKSHKTLLVMQEIIKEKYPEYLLSFENYAYGYKMSFGNMFIAKKEIFDAYSKWLFEFLRVYEAKIREKKMNFPPRLLGFVAEILLNIWTDVNLKKVKYLFVFNTETNHKGKMYKIKRFLIKVHLFSYIEDLYYKIYRLVKRY